MVLCNIPHARAQNATITVDGFIIQSVYGNGTGELVTRDGDPIPGTIGGPPTDGTPENNTVTIRNGVVDNGVYGSWAASGIVISNKVTVTGNIPGSTVNDVYGGYVERGFAVNNEVIIEDNSRVRGSVAGGYARAITTDTTIGTTSNNTVTIRSGAIITGDVYGGRSGSAINNVVNIEGGTVNGTRIVGGGSDNTDALSAYFNEVNISAGSIIDGNVYGGLINIADALENSVNITGGLLAGSVFGGVTGFGNSERNTVTINGTVVTGGNDIIGGRSSQGAAVENKIYITDSQFLNNGGVIAGGSTSVGDARANSVYIDGGEVGIQSVTGGTSNIGNSINNTVAIGENGGKFSISTLTGGTSASGSANGNTVEVYRGTFNNIYGGMTSGNGNATGNTVILHGGTFNGYVIGGSSSAGAATGNIVDIHPGVVMGNNARIYGGLSTAGRDSRSGNTLNIRGPIKVSGLNNFENYNFYLPADLAANQTMITVTGGSGSGSGSDRTINLKDANVEIDVRDSKLQQGDTVILIDEQGGFGFNGEPANKISDGTKLRVKNDDLRKFTFSLKVEDNQLRADLLGVTLNSKTKSLPDGFLSGLILANQGADAIAGSAMDSAMTAAHKGPIGGMGGFGSLVIGKSKYDTGSDVDMTGVSAAAGLALGVDFSKSSLTLGPFLEYGKGEYDTVNSTEAGREVRGDGNSEYMGGGFLLRADYKDVGLGRYFAEASVRVGSQKNNFSINMPDEDGEIEKISYKSSSPYFGIHLGYGGSWDVASKTGLDIYGKYFFARGKNSEVSMSNDDAINFGNLTSNRIRGGLRVFFAPDDRLTASFGGAYEYEMNGETVASLLSYNIGDAPSLKGGTGIGEVVIGYKPSEKSPTSINIGIQGYAGKRQGVTASVYVRF